MRYFVMTLAVLLIPIVSAGEDCEIPPLYENHVYSVAADTLLIGLGIDDFCYSPEGSIRVYMMLQNIGECEFRWECGQIKPQAWALHSACESAEAPGCSAFWYFWPWWSFCDMGEELLLEPGECMHITFEWDMPGARELPDGAYGLLAVYSYDCGTCEPRVVHDLPRGGLRVDFDIDSAIVPVGRISWGKIKALYR